MSEAITDGFFFNPAGADVADIARRAASGALDPRLDDVFSVALQETIQEQDRLKKRRDRLEAELARTKDDLAAVEAKHERQIAAIEKYQRGDDLDANERNDLTPDCARFEREQLKDEKDAEFEAVKGDIPEGWETTAHRVDDHFIYVTIRRERTRPASTPQPIRKRIDALLEGFFRPDFDREGRVQLWDRKASLQPPARAGP